MVEVYLPITTESAKCSTAIRRFAPKRFFLHGADKAYHGIFNASMSQEKDIRSFWDTFCVLTLFAAIRVSSRCFKKRLEPFPVS